MFRATFFMQIHKGKLIIIMINFKAIHKDIPTGFPFLYSSHKNYLKQISDKTDASEKGEGKGTESKGRPVSVGSQIIFHKHPGCDTDECREGDEKDLLRRRKARLDHRTHRNKAHGREIPYCHCRVFDKRCRNQGK